LRCEEGKTWGNQASRQVRSPGKKKDQRGGGGVWCNKGLIKKKKVVHGFGGKQSYCLLKSKDRKAIPPTGHAGVEKKREAMNAREMKKSTIGRNLRNQPAGVEKERHPKNEENNRRSKANNETKATRGRSEGKKNIA